MLPQPTQRWRSRRGAACTDHRRESPPSSSPLGVRFWGHRRSRVATYLTRLIGNYIRSHRRFDLRCRPSPILPPSIQAFGASNRHPRPPPLLAPAIHDHCSRAPTFFDTQRTQHQRFVDAYRVPHGACPSLHPPRRRGLPPPPRSHPCRRGPQLPLLPQQQPLPGTPTIRAMSPPLPLFPSLPLGMVLPLPHATLSPPPCSP